MRWWRKIRYSRFCRKGSLPPQICNYIDLVRLPIKKNPLAKLRFVVLDTETTGLDAKKDQILEIGAIAINEKRIVLEDRFHAIIAHEDLIKSDAVSVHGLMPQEMQEKGIGERKALLQFISYIGNAVLVAHHAYFDIEILSQRLEHHFGIRLLNFYVDTFHCAIRMEHNVTDYSSVKEQEYSLDRLVERFMVTAHDRHTAMGDAFMTAQVFLKLLHQAHKRKLTLLKDLLVRA